MGKSDTSKYKPKARVYGTLTKKYIPLKELKPDEVYDEQDIIDFQIGLIFGIIHEN